MDLLRCLWTCKISKADYKQRKGSSTFPISTTRYCSSERAHDRTQKDIGSFGSEFAAHS